MKTKYGKSVKHAQGKVSQSTRADVQQGWINEALIGNFSPGSAARLRKLAAKARSVRPQLAEECIRRRNEVRSGKIKPTSANGVYRRIQKLFAK